MLVTGIRSTRVCAAGDSFQPRTWAGWVPVTSTGMREPARILQPKKKALRGHGSGLARHSIRYRKPDGGV
ncbi:MAG: hypothetical protein DI595_17760 [Agrobacterium fabrum]|uniref:Uncharacterized protein n=1 Tax=Agrobacterium fabrum TaxID=1176649 RepID=A0A2W5ET09_9HYPH|nr:MAG: hypothetical protein DI595_17760 [Agrobacterium fabrum]